MTLQSTAQTKKFIAEGASINKRATVGAFYIQRKSSSKSFADTHDFSTRQANSQSFHGTHTGDFAGVSATGNPVRVPYSVFYDVDADSWSMIPHGTPDARCSAR